MKSYELRCPNCESRIDFGHAAAEATVEHGCPMCGGAITGDHVILG